MRSWMPAARLMNRATLTNSGFQSYTQLDQVERRADHTVERFSLSSSYRPRWLYAEDDSFFFSQNRPVEQHRDELRAQRIAERLALCVALRLRVKLHKCQCFRLICDSNKI